jgi:Zn-dependent M28 family amino/carboxypeptidase
MVNQYNKIQRWVFGVLPFYLFTFLLFFSACHTAKKAPGDEQAVVKVQFCADSAYLFCQQQCDFGPRTMNSEAHERCAQWIQQKFQQYGYEVELQKADLRGYDGTILKSTNIIAQHPSPNTQHPTPKGEGSSAESRPRILVCAHWDSRPWADNDPDSLNWRKPVLAANDGASGVAVMLELARLLGQQDSLSVAVDFVCFDAADLGVPQWEEQSDGDSWALGAQYWATNTQHPSPNTYRYALLLDMVGGQGAKFYQEGYSLKYARPIVDKVWQAAHAAGYGSYFPMQSGGYVTDDHVPLNEKAHIPTIDIINHYPDCPQSSFGPTWHTISDDMQHIDRNTLQAVGQTLLQVILSE